MSTQNQISVVIPQATVEAVTTKLQECKTMLAPFLKTLSARERKQLFKMGNKTVSTVQKTKSYVETNGEFAPNYMDKVEFLKDEAVVTQLGPVVNLANQLAIDVSDTVMLAGSEALKQSLYYYGAVKQAQEKGVASAKPIYEDLSERFARKNTALKIETL
jgi:hypothetical protein